MHSIRVREVPELDDDFAGTSATPKALPSYGSKSARRWKKRLGAGRQGDAFQAHRSSRQSDGWWKRPKCSSIKKSIASSTNLPVPSSYQGINPQTYLEQTEQTVDDFRERFREEAEQRVKGFFVASDCPA